MSIVLNALDKQILLRTYWERYGPFRFVVETGIWNGNGSCMQFAHEADYVAIELNETSAQLAHAKGFDVRVGDSARWLPTLLSSRRAPALFWLDAHLASESGEEDHSPLLEELSAILRWPHAGKSVVLIDDVRMFDRAGWPSLEAVYALVYGPLSRWQVDEKDDVLRLTPFDS